MLSDVIYLTKYIFENGLNKQQSFQLLYRTYESLAILIKHIDITANIYLPKTFEEEDLINTTSFPIPQEKWRYFLNKQLKITTHILREYLEFLGCFIEDLEPFFYKFFHWSIHCEIEKNYIFGNVEKSLELHTTQLNLKSKSDLITKKFSLKSFEQRKNLQLHLNKQNNILKIELQKLKSYILNFCRIEELLDEIVDYKTDISVFCRE